MLTVIPIPAFQDNYIWLLRQDASDKVVIVDPGDAQPVIEYLEREGLSLAAILVTHHHHDHTGGIDALVKRYSPRVIGPDNSAIPAIDEVVGDEDECRVQGRRFEVFAVPGHTLDHIAFYAPGTPGLLFCGDTLFSGGCGRLFEGTAEQMHRSLARLAALPDDTLVFAGHEYTLANLRFAQAAEPDNPARDAHLGECERARQLERPTLPSTIGRERQINPFLRIDQPGLLNALAEQGSVDDDSAAFATLRGWKDRF
ncbi:MULTISPECIES: hydroxyacylglutathione hydrolase [Chromohalobacter]|uniref:Hydroxyacylglutathione hydrolase n=1 Tax=Chromohalobacter israelensis (strain ATCC BAA-138 / DSM 3043 / CIP 106854 / NCIMB 13768 / 1H11) TaxID=290398 RepID=GLO2_CHRI1|nr:MULTISPECIES: hydroxyacylglutathione hydrolase [Chromohalobacter]Q1QW62.1 RecName: Full=Hydroxyacylglutathione hydrolase; AltName: Full=Glyoxalase II; Short=Glx II [Chromohalobacter salexigens DSM 3043]ABE59296.1 Hydroxyacylglutathione hydrolase [Chromohalobacter salexigens DSM 3043]MBZ5876965.1 hydroxyacylglutathione hydrolase [Chromohalobacter salexigens]MDF9434357.1 hydroxyacylglutathione hydrolase [Chromohalobacter israelensis]MDO0946560.1 hydroxyacylglutathione hydrolase [Chromohalobac